MSRQSGFKFNCWIRLCFVLLLLRIWLESPLQMGANSHRAENGEERPHTGNQVCVQRSSSSLFSWKSDLTQLNWGIHNMLAQNWNINIKEVDSWRKHPPKNHFKVFFCQLMLCFIPRQMFNSQSSEHTVSLMFKSCTLEHLIIWLIMMAVWEFKLIYLLWFVVFPGLWL